MSGYRSGSYGMAQGYAALIGVVLVASGLLGFINNPIVGAGPTGNGTGVILAANNVHNIVHLLTGVIALYIAFGLRGESQVNAILIFGILYAIIFVALLVSPTLFGLFDPIPANTGDHVLHAALAVASFAVWYLSKNATPSAQTVR